MVFINIFVSYKCNESKAIKDVLSLGNEIEIYIIEIHYQKDSVSDIENEKIVISIDYLKEMFLNRAVIISGEEMNYCYGFERVSIIGLIRCNTRQYQFVYNLAGFGWIFINDKETIMYGDPVKEIFMG